VHGLEAEYWGRIDFIYLDREDPANGDIVNQFGVTYQPVFILLTPDGIEVQRWFYGTADIFHEILDAYLTDTGR
jgi:hypothetical protein